MDIIKLKAEMFDIIREQRKLEIKLNNLQTIIIEKEKILVNLELNGNIKIGEVIKW